MPIDLDAPLDDSPPDLPEDSAEFARQIQRAIKHACGAGCSPTDPGHGSSLAILQAAALRDPCPRIAAALSLGIAPDSDFVNCLHLFESLAEHGNAAAAACGAHMDIEDLERARACLVDCSKGRCSFLISMSLLDAHLHSDIGLPSLIELRGALSNPWDAFLLDPLPRLGLDEFAELARALEGACSRPDLFLRRLASNEACSLELLSALVGAAPSIVLDPDLPGAIDDLSDPFVDDVAACGLFAKAISLGMDASGCDPRSFFQNGIRSLTEVAALDAHARRQPAAPKAIRRL